MADPRLPEGNVTNEHDIRMYPSNYRVRRWGRWWRKRGYYDVRCNTCRFVNGPLTREKAYGVKNGHDSAVGQTRFAVSNELRRWIAEFDERSGPDKNPLHCGLEEATWTWAADLLRGRVGELEGGDDLH